MFPGGLRFGENELRSGSESLITGLSFTNPFDRVKLPAVSSFLQAIRNSLHEFDRLSDTRASMLTSIYCVLDGKLVSYTGSITAGSVIQRAAIEDLPTFLTPTKSFLVQRSFNIFSLFTHKVLSQQPPLTLSTNTHSLASGSERDANDRSLSQVQMRPRV